MFTSQSGGWKMIRNLMQAFDLTSRLINTKQPNTIITFANYSQLQIQPCFHHVTRQMYGTHRFWVLRRSTAGRGGRCRRSGRCFRTWGRRRRWLWRVSHTCLYKQTCWRSSGIVYQREHVVYFCNICVISGDEQFITEHLVRNHLQMTRKLIFKKSKVSASCVFLFMFHLLNSIPKIVALDILSSGNTLYTLIIKILII